MPSERPDGPLSSILYDYHQQTMAATNHLAIEGYPEVNVQAVLDSYDRNLHPWMHGRRFPDIIEKIRGWWPW